MMIQKHMIFNKTTTKNGIFKGQAKSTLRTFVKKLKIHILRQITSNLHHILADMKLDK
jgi:hypothetical protein